jgi:four helix bundle protein
LGSAFEWETQLIVAYNEKYINEKQFQELETKVQDLQKMISGFIDGLDKKS